MTALTIYQGDSSDTIALDVYRNSTKVTDLTGFVANFVFVANIGDDPIFNGTFVDVDGQFRRQLTPAEMADIPPGNYFVVAQISSVAYDFKRETQIAIIVNKQGYIE